MRGVHVGAGKKRGKVIASIGGKRVGVLPRRETLLQTHGEASSDAYPTVTAKFDLSSDQNSNGEAPTLILARGNDATWFVPRVIELCSKQPNGETVRIAQWRPEMPGRTSSAEAKHGVEAVRFKLDWTQPTFDE